MKLSSLRVNRGAFYSFFLSFLCPLCLCGSIRADELNTPYDLTIVVHVAENRLLTDVFRKRIQRDLHDGFQAALGDMGRATVTDKHPRLAEVLARGLHSLDDWKDRDDKKTHFVLIDYSGVHYEIQTRQYDGTIGRASPVVRRDRTRDRDFVAKAAALLIKKDFGVLGTVRTEPEGAKKTVTIELRGGALGDMTRWVKKDDVFALAPPDGSKPLQLKWSLLQVEQAPAEDARNGVCVCRFFHRYQVRGGIAGYRCIKLGTVEAPLRIRWMQQIKGGRLKPLDRRLTVDIRRYGFDGEESSELQNSSDANGVLEAVDEKGKIVLFNNVAFVRVIGGLGNAAPQVPVALVDDQPVLIEVNASKDFNPLFSMQKSDWQTSVAASVNMQAELFKSLERLAANPANRAESIAVATSGMKRAKKDREELLKDKRDLLKENKDLKTPIEDRRIQQLEEYEQALADFIAKQKKIEETENDPQRKKLLSEIERAKLLEKELEYDKALEIYERIQNGGFKDAELDQHVEKVRKAWPPSRNKEHQEARGFIYRVWPTLEISRLEEKIPAANNAFQKCKDADDFITIQKLLKGTEGHADRLRKKLEELRPDLIIDDEKEAQQLKKVSEQIAKLGEEIQDYLKARAGGK